MFMFFFFQAEDGIRDLTVTGVQTCALPICDAAMNGVAITTSREVAKLAHTSRGMRKKLIPGARIVMIVTRKRSEERRVGKGVDLGGRRIIKKKKRKNIRRGCCTRHNNSNTE